MLDLLIVGFCLFLNAFFSAYEIAFVTTSAEDMDELEVTKKSVSTKVRHFKKRPERTLSIIQIGISLVAAIAAAVGGTGAVESLEPYFVANYGISESTAEGIAVTLVILPLTYLTVVFGELVPKSIALKHPQTVLLIGTAALSKIEKIISPVVTFLEVSTNYLIKKLNIPPPRVSQISRTIDIGGLPVYHQKFVENLVSLKTKRVAKIMVPWEKVIHLNFSDTEEEVRSKIEASPFSRFPVIDQDTVVGILYVKELAASATTPWEGLVRKAAIVKGTDKILDAFLEMQRKQAYLAVVVCDHTKFIGIITVKDILGEVVGEIHDITDETPVMKLLSDRNRFDMRKDVRH